MCSKHSHQPHAMFSQKGRRILTPQRLLLMSIRMMRKMAHSMRTNLSISNREIFLARCMRLSNRHVLISPSQPASGSWHVVSDSSHSQVRLSPQANTFFSEQCIAANVPQLELLKWCRTRWSSADNMIERLLRLQPVCASDSSLIGVEVTVCSRLFETSSILQMTATVFPSSPMAAITSSLRFRM